MGRVKRYNIILRPGAAALIFCALMTDRSFFMLWALIAAALHESGHIIAAKLLDIEITRLELDITGAKISTSMFRSYKEEWLLAASGPAVNLLSSAAIALIPPLRERLYIFALASLSLAFINLLPIREFDGGRMLSSFLCSFLDPDLSDRLEKVISFIFVTSLWVFSVYLLIRFGKYFSLFVFSVGIFRKIFLSPS